MVTNATTAWLYGASAVNTTLFGIGERTGNCPLEAMLIEYNQLKRDKEADLTCLNDIRRFFEKEFGYIMDPKRPFVGDDFNMTKAGVHADGLLKCESIYNSFDTKKILNRPIVIKINQTSGLAGIAAWMNHWFGWTGMERISKRDPLVAQVKEWVDHQYENGRTTTITDEELVAVTNQCTGRIRVME